jgi:hypothetical protein
MIGLWVIFFPLLYCQVKLSLREWGNIERKMPHLIIGLLGHFSKCPRVAGCSELHSLLPGAWLSLASSFIYYMNFSLLSIWSLCRDYINNVSASTVDMESEIQSLARRFQSSRQKGQATHRIAKDLQWRQLTPAWTWLEIHWIPRSEPETWPGAGFPEALGLLR